MPEAYKVFAFSSLPYLTKSCVGERKERKTHRTDPSQQMPSQHHGWVRKPAGLKSVLTPRRQNSIIWLLWGLYPERSKTRGWTGGRKPEKWPRSTIEAKEPVAACKDTVDKEAYLLSNPRRTPRRGLW